MARSEDKYPSDEYLLHNPSWDMEDSPWKARLGSRRGQAVGITPNLFHSPLALSALSVARETTLLSQRTKVGHIHYFTKNLALELLKEAGFELYKNSEVPGVWAGQCRQYSLFSRGLGL